MYGIRDKDGNEIRCLFQNNEKKRQWFLIEDREVTDGVEGYLDPLENIVYNIGWHNGGAGMDEVLEEAVDKAYKNELS